MKRKFSRILCAFLAVWMLAGMLPVPAWAACSHSYTKVYTIENEKMHSFKSKCTKCGAVVEGSGYSGWADHTYNSSGKCTACGHCKHLSSSTSYSYENDKMHSWVKKCSACGKQLDGGWNDHTFSGGTCSLCGYTRSCTHPKAKTTYTDYSSTQHKRASYCSSCGITYNTTTESHSWSYSSWKSVSSSSHSRTKSCACGRSTTETGSHTFSGNTCTVCGYKKSGSSAETPSKPVSASVSLTASGPSGKLGSAGGEISSEKYPAS